MKTCRFLNIQNSSTPSMNQCVCASRLGQPLQSIMETPGEQATYLALMEATLGNYKLEKQTFILLWKEFKFPDFNFPNGLFKINIFSHI